VSDLTTLKECWQFAGAAIVTFADLLIDCDGDCKMGSEGKSAKCTGYSFRYVW
jgi:hypothetical protein